MRSKHVIGFIPALYCTLTVLCLPHAWSPSVGRPGPRWQRSARTRRNPSLNGGRQSSLRNMPKSHSAVVRLQSTLKRRSTIGTLTDVGLKATTAILSSLIFRLRTFSRDSSESRDSLEMLWKLVVGRVSWSKPLENWELPNSFSTGAILAGQCWR